MDSSFLTWLNAGLGTYLGISFLKILIQFGLPNRPARFTSYLITLCAASYFCAETSIDFGLLSSLTWIKWRPIPLVIGGLSLLLQVVMLVGRFSLIQQKVMSRFPIIGGIICFALFPQRADVFFGFILVLGFVFLWFSASKARLQRRNYFKMVLFWSISALLKWTGIYLSHLIGGILLFPAAFYFLLFQQGILLNTLFEEFELSLEGDTKK